MHEVEVNVVHAQVLQGRVDALGHALVPGVVELGGDPDLLAGHPGSPHALTHLGLVAVGIGCVDVPVAGLERVLDGLGRLAFGRLPCAQADGRDLVPRGEGVGLTVPGTKDVSLELVHTESLAVRSHTHLVCFVSAIVNVPSMTSRGQMKADWELGGK